MNARPLTCKQIEADLVATAVGEAGPAADRRVRVHTDRCPPCKDELERYQAIDGAVGALRSQPLATADAARARERLETRLLDLKSRIVAYRVFPSPFGNVLIARSELGVVLLEYLERAGGLAASRLSRAGDVEAIEDAGEVEPFYRDFRAYLEGRTAHLDWPLDLRLAHSDFHRAVLRATAAIPYGAVASYKGLARTVGRPEAVRAVAQALRWNPIPVAIPCHRVIGSTGALVGYAGGETSRKQKLLSVEGVPLTRLPHDFRICRDLMYVQMPGDTDYCLPSCPSTVSLRTKAPVFFGSRERAEAAGLGPCTTCRPDLHPLRARGR